MKKKLQTQKKITIYNLLPILLLTWFITGYTEECPAKGMTQAVQQMNEKKFSLNIENKTIKEILYEIQKKSRTSFIYGDIKELESLRKSLKITNVTVAEALKLVFENTNLTFTMGENSVTISKKPTAGKEIPQKVSVKGTVLDSKGEPLTGATVIVRNTSIGGISDGLGRFNISFTSGSSVEFSMTGFKPRSLVINQNNDNLIVSMEEDIMQMNDVVVTGYQMIDKRMLTSSIEKINAEDMDRIGALTVDQMLEGKAAGLMITNISATPGAASKVRIRSGGTFTGSRAPLWVVDGVIYEDPVPLSAEDINSFDNVNLIGNAITGLNPDDIENINILKDASATAIYGTRASNGVIVVTTRRGKIGKASINYSGSVRLVDRPRYDNFRVMNSKERVDVSREIMEKNLAYPSENFSYVGYEGALRDYKLNLLSFDQFNERVSKLETMNIDWFGELYRMAVNTNHNLNVSGGTDNVKYYFSVGYNDEKGTERGVDLNRITARSNLDVRLTKNLTVAMGISGSVQNAKYNHNSISAFDEAYYNSRAVECYDENGALSYVQKKIGDGLGANLSAGYNILNELNNSERNIDNKDFNINAQMDWDIVKGIKFRAMTSYRNTTNITEEWIAENTFCIAKLRTYENVEDKIDEYVKNNAMVPFGGLYSGSNTNQTSIIGQAQLNLNKIIAQKHHFNLNLGYEATTTHHNGVSGWEAPGYNHDQGRSFVKLPSFSINQSGTITGLDFPAMVNWLTEAKSKDIYPSIMDKTSNTLSAFMIFTYSYGSRYILNFNMRSDGSNKFGQYEKYKFKPTWSVSGRWNLHKESFFKNVTFMDELSLRVSYGFRGNPPSGTPYMVIRDFRKDPRYNEMLAKMVNFPNSNLTWEKTSTLNLGLNHSWFNGRLSGSFDMGYSKGTDLLLSRPVSLVNGRATQQYNGGSKEDYSYEMSLRGVIVKTADFGFSLGLNFTHTKENILAGYMTENSLLTVSNYLNGNIYLTGFPVDAFYSYKFSGLDKNGAPEFLGLTDAPKSGTMTEYFANALDYSGSRIPKFYGGINTDFKYKQFSFRASFSYKFGHSVRKLNLYNGSQNMPMPSENMSSEFNKRWRSSADDGLTTIPALSNRTYKIGSDVLSEVKVWDNQIITTGSTLWNVYDLSNERVVDASHIRINNLTFGYSFPKNLLNKWKINSLRASLQVSNVGVIVFDKKLKGQDPEQVKSVGMPALPTYSISMGFGF